MKKRLFVLSRFRHSLRMYSIVALMMLAVITASLLPLDGQASTALSPAMYGISIVIDAGHGGWDPGKIGASSEEAEINLAVARALAEYCRNAGALVTMTRETDNALGDSKSEDMQKRVEIATAANADIFISLHCNSFVSSPAQHGAQAFYQKGNEAGRLLAEAVQTAITDQLGNTTRSALTHPSSYLLEKIDCSAVICEMGFLTNSEEEKLLQTEDYQWQMAWAIYCGLISYLQI